MTLSPGFAIMQNGPGVSLGVSASTTDIAVGGIAVASITGRSVAVGTMEPVGFGDAVAVRVTVGIVVGTGGVFDWHAPSETSVRSRNVSTNAACRIRTARCQELFSRQRRFGCIVNRASTRVRING